MKNLDRVSWDTYFMNIATMVASRSTCPRKAVGAVIVKNHAILSTGYNGSMSGAPHCTDVGCMIENDHCVATIHAEANAIIHAARHGIPMEGATIYVTASPCWNCFKMLINSGVRRICYGEFYREPKILEWAPRLGVELVRVAPGDAPSPPAAAPGTMPEDH